MDTVFSKLQSYTFRMIVWFCVLIYASVDGQIMTGEPRSVPVNDTQVLAAARFAVAEFNGVNAEEQFVYRIMTITSAKIQVVAGINYILDVLLGRTVCRKSAADADSETCALHSKPKCFRGQRLKAAEWWPELEASMTSDLYLGVWLTPENTAQQWKARALA